MNVTHQISTPSGMFKCVVDPSSAKFLNLNPVVDKLTALIVNAKYNAEVHYLRITVTMSGEEDASINILPMVALAPCVVLGSAKPEPEPQAQTQVDFSVPAAQPNEDMESKLSTAKPEPEPQAQTQVDFSVPAAQPNEDMESKLSIGEDLSWGQFEGHGDNFKNIDIETGSSTPTKSPLRKKPCSRETPPRKNYDICRQLSLLSPYKPKAASPNCSNVVVVSSLQPDFFDENSLLRFFNRKARKHSFLLDQSEAVDSIKDYDQTANTCKVEFKSSELAQSFLSLSPLIYEDEEIILQPILRDPPANCDPSAAVLIVERLQTDIFFLKHFEKFVNKTCWKYKFIQMPDKAVASVFDFNAKEKTCKVKFNSVELSMSFLSLSPIVYDFEEIVLKPVDRPTTVLVGSLQDDFELEHFENFVNMTCWKSGFIQRPYKAVVGVLDYDANDKSCKVKFQSSDLAMSFISLHPLIYDYEEVSLMPSGYSESRTNVINGNNQSQSPLVSSTEDNDTSVLAEPLDEVEYNSDEEVILPPGVLYRNDWPRFESLQLLQLCLKYRDLVMHVATRKKGEGYTKVQRGMMQRKLYYSLFQVKKHLKGMLTAYESGTCEFSTFVSELKGDTAPNSSNIEAALLQARCDSSSSSSSAAGAKVKKNNKNKYHNGVLIMEDCLVVDNGSKFTKESDFLLIAEYKKNKECFDDDKHRADEVYSKILQVFHQKGYQHLSSTDLSTRMAYLANQFKRKYDAILNLTGTSSDASKWVYYDAMGQILEKSVVCKPQKILAVGARHVYQERKPSTKKNPFSGGSYKAQRLENQANLLHEFKDFKMIVQQSLSPVSE